MSLRGWRTARVMPSPCKTKKNTTRQSVRTRVQLTRSGIRFVVFPLRHVHFPLRDFAICISIRFVRKSESPPQMPSRHARSVFSPFRHFRRVRGRAFVRPHTLRSVTVVVAPTIRPLRPPNNPFLSLSKPNTVHTPSNQSSSREFALRCMSFCRSREFHSHFILQ